MKKLYSLIVSALALGAVGCVTDNVVNDVEAPQDGVVLSISTANSTTKVALGNGADGTYQVYWSEGDKISVNGSISEEAVINASNPGSAQFRVGAVLKYPYNILYPASATSVAVFSALQNYVEGTFESGATPMYGVKSNANESVKLKHLGGVMRFNILAPTEGVVLKNVVITAGEGSIAGEFEVDFETGAITPSANLSSSIEYSFGNGLELSTTEAKSLYVAMPKGEYGRCLVEINTTDGGVMYARFNTSGESEIKNGVIRNFAPIKFKYGATCTLSPFEVEEDELTVDMSTYTKAPDVDGDYLVINEPRQLIWLCYNEPVLNSVTYSKIKVGKDIDMGEYSLLSLSSMKLQAGTEIDGNGKSITGVNMGKDASSIFGDNKNLNIHDLTLTNCSVNTALQTGAAILVGKADEGLTVSDVTFNNCSVVAPCKIGLVAGAMHTGTFSVSGVTADSDCLVETSYVSGESGLAGGLVGCYAKNGDGETTSTATFTNCTTSATVKSYMEASNYFYGKMVGQLGGYNNNEKLYFVDCSATNATLVPLYDQGALHAQTAVLSYCEAHRADFCETTLDSATDNLLGGERYCRGMVYYNGERFFAEWDGKRSATMLTEVVDDVTYYLIYSPYDLAKAQGTKYNLTKPIRFKVDVDMGGHLFNPVQYIYDLDGENHELHNLKIEQTYDAVNTLGAAFIRQANNWSTHKNLTFVGADITCNHDASIAAPAYGNTEDGGAGNAYAGVLASRSWRTEIKDADGNGTGTYTDYKVSNVHVRDSKVRGVCKVGGLIGACRGQVYIDNCSVDNCVIENYDPQIVNYYTMLSTVSSLNYVVDGLQWWYTAGECGGLIGFLETNTAEITNCSVINSQINCTGQPNKDVVANIWDSSAWTEGTYVSGTEIRGNATTTIAGRHINQFIGDVRSRRKEGNSDYVMKVLNYTVLGNSYNGVAAESTNDYNHNYASGSYCEIAGCVYYTGVDIGSIKHVSECAGEFVFSAKNGAETTLTEAVGSGDNMDWFGGNCKNLKYTFITKAGTSYYPAAPTE